MTELRPVPPSAPATPVRPVQARQAPPQRRGQGSSGGREAPEATPDEHAEVHVDTYA